ncbi:tyrosine-protein phosphatase [Streptomyces sp. NPDC004549]|uniref:tyrosine-protein phosphatase n=1 Tax=Streptomyces sp. NPDC004549 TaxID=3154283 RepID=UPI0033BD2A2C
MAKPDSETRSASHLLPAQKNLPDVPNVRNFRDACISPMRPGILYRSGSLNRLTAVGAERIRELGVRTVVDLRSGVESNVWPGQTHGLDIEWVPIPALPELDALKAMGFPDFSGFDGKPWPMDPAALYPFMATYGAPAIAALVKRLAEPTALPAVVQCAVGKDRTGLAVAVIQSLLGAPWDQVVGDYVRSNVELELTAGPTSFLDEAGVTRYSHPVSESLLASAMDTILTGFGSIPAYLAPYGITETDLDALRSNLLA